MFYIFYIFYTCSKKKITAQHKLFVSDWVLIAFLLLTLNWIEPAGCEMTHLTTLLA